MVTGHAEDCGRFRTTSEASVVLGNHVRKRPLFAPSFRYVPDYKVDIAPWLSVFDTAPNAQDAARDIWLVLVLIRTARV